MIKIVTSILFLIFTLQTLSYSKDYQQSLSKNNIDALNSDSSWVDLNIKEKKDYAKFKFLFSGGYSYMIAKLSDQIDPSLENFWNELRSGYNIGVGAAYFIRENIGIGFKYNYFNTENSIFPVTDTAGNRGTLSMNKHIQYFAPSAQYTYQITPDAEIILYLSFGYVSYKNEAVLIDPVTITGGTLASELGMSLNLGLANNIDFHMDIHYFSAALFSVHYDYGNRKETYNIENGESLARIDLNLGLQFKF